MHTSLLVLLGGIISGFFGLVFGLIYLAFIIGVFVGAWKTFEKAGKPGWGFLIPIYNLVLLHEIVGREMIKLLWWFVPVINLYFIITLYISLGKSFGKQGAGELLLTLFFWPFYLGLGSARYVGPSEGASTTTNGFRANPETY